MKETIKKLKNLPVGKWYSVKSKDGTDLSELIKELIDLNEQFEFSDNMLNFKRLDDGWLFILQ